MIQTVNSSKQKFIDTAHRLFSQRGFYGVSLADVADELSLTKQSVLHHFKTKAALYGEVFEGVASRLEVIMATVAAHPGTGEDKLRIYLEKLHTHMQECPLDARLIARELLDNLDRAQTSRKWYLKRFLDESVALVAATPRWQRSSLEEQTAATLQLFGAISYFATAEVTFEAIWGRERMRGTQEVYLSALLRQALSSPAEGASQS